MGRFKTHEERVNKKLKKYAQELAKKKITKTLSDGRKVEVKE